MRYFDSNFHITFWLLFELKVLFLQLLLLFLDFICFVLKYLWPFFDLILFVFRCLLNYFILLLIKLFYNQYIRKLVY